MVKRLHVEDDLAAGTVVPLDRTTANRVLNVLRMREGASVTLFNGRDGEWRARLTMEGRKAASLAVTERVRPQATAPTLEVLLAPIKRMDYAIQKSVEMGAGRVRLVRTERTQAQAKPDKLAAYAAEAAEQCGSMHVPPVEPTRSMADVTAAWDGRPLLFCDEGNDGAGALVALGGFAAGPLAVLIGPEGGFSSGERARLRALPFVTPLPLGPRILRADTALVAALALVQATVGDWH